MNVDHDKIPLLFTAKVNLGSVDVDVISVKHAFTSVTLYFFSDMERLIENEKIIAEVTCTYSGREGVT